MKFFSISGDYLAYLHKFDHRVPYAPSKPDAAYSERRPYMLAASLQECKLYAPLEHPRKRHRGLSACSHIVPIDGGRHGQIALNNMIPVPDSEISRYSPQNGSHMGMFFCQLDFCAKNESMIRKRAYKTVKRLAKSPNSFERATFCDFMALIKAMESYSPR